MIDKKGKLFGKINLFDLIVIILIVVLLFGVAYKVFVMVPDKMTPRGEEQTVDVTFDVLIESVRDATVNTFHVGDTLFYYNSEEDLGKITAITPNPATDILETLDGTVINAPVQDRYDLVLTVSGSATRYEDGTLMMAKTRVVDGIELRVATQMANCIGTVKNLKWK